MLKTIFHHYRACGELCTCCISTSNTMSLAVCILCFKSAMDSKIPFIKYTKLIAQRKWYNHILLFIFLLQLQFSLLKSLKLVLLNILSWLNGNWNRQLCIHISLSTYQCVLYSSSLIKMPLCALHSNKQHVFTTGADHIKPHQKPKCKSLKSLTILKYTSYKCLHLFLKDKKSVEVERGVAVKLYVCV